MIALNKQQVSPVDHDDLDGLVVVDTFPTIQGEGPYAGMPAYFIRLAGCNLRCLHCDTNYTDNAKWIKNQDLADLALASKKPLVVITGGEPFRQNILNLCWILYSAGITVQIETNGTLYIDPQLSSFPSLTANIYQKIRIVCSPKTPNIHPKLVPYISDYKYIIGADVDETDGLPTTILGRTCRVYRPERSRLVTIWCQPEDVQDPELNKIYLQKTVQIVQKYNYRLCLQTHKIVGLP